MNGAVVVTNARAVVANPQAAIAKTVELLKNLSAPVENSVNFTEAEYLVRRAN